MALSLIQQSICHFVFVFRFSTALQGSSRKSHAVLKTGWRAAESLCCCKKKNSSGAVGLLSQCRCCHVVVFAVVVVVATPIARTILLHLRTDRLRQRRVQDRLYIRVCGLPAGLRVFAWDSEALVLHDPATASPQRRH